MHQNGMDAAAELFAKVNAGADLTPDIPHLVGGRDAEPALTLFAVQKPANRDLVLAALRSADPRFLWYINEGSVCLPWVSFGWERQDPRPERPKVSWLRKLVPEPSSTPATFTPFRVELRDGYLSWFERNFVIEQAVEEFNANGPPRWPAPDDVLTRLRALVGGPAGDNRALARDRLRRAIGEASGDGCAACAPLSKPQTANFREGERLPGAGLLTIAERNFPHEELQRCLRCGAHFLFTNDFELGYEDRDWIDGISAAEALAFVNDVERPCFIVG